jgi:hypothetical protein
VLSPEFELFNACRFGTNSIREGPHAAVDGTSCTATTQDADTVSFGPPLPYFGLSPPRWLVATSRRDFGSETLQDPVCLQRGIAVVELEEVKSRDVVYGVVV